jgi:fibronectin-binding autotransporter adhesin
MATRTKANNTTALNNTGSWDEGAVPTSADDVVWNVNQTAAIGGAVSMKTLTIGVSGTAGISASTTNALTIGGTINAGSATAAFTIACPVILSTDCTITVNTSQTVTISGIVSGAFTSTKDGSGTLTLSGANTYGNHTISAGILKVQTVAFSTTARTYAISSGAVLNVDGATNIPTGTATINGSGTLRVTTSNWTNSTGTGRTVALSLNSDGLIDIQSGAKLTNGGWQCFNWASNLANLRVDGTLDCWDGNTVTYGALLGSGSIVKTSYGANVLYLDHGKNNASGTYSGTTANTVGTLAPIKYGSGTQILSGICAHTGETTNWAGNGALLINGSTASGTSVKAKSGCIIGGTGTINGPLLTEAGGIIQPTVSGASGTLTYASATAINFASPSTFKVRAPSTVDRLTLSSATPVFTATNVALIVDATGLTTNVTNATIVSTAKTPNGVTGTFSSVSVVGGSFSAAVTYNTDSITLSLTEITQVSLIFD